MSPEAGGRGDRRREALLAALDRELRVDRLDEVSVGSVTRAAGVSRSAFYFYFDSKADAVLELLSGVFTEAGLATDLLEGEAPAVRRAHVRAAVAGLVGSALTAPHVYLAMIDAQVVNDGVRARWEEGRRALTAPVAEYIRAERSRGIAPPGPDAEVLAEMLVRVNESVVEDAVRGRDTGRDDAPDRETALDCVAEMWMRCVYGEVADGDVTGGGDGSGPAEDPAAETEERR